MSLGHFLIHLTPRFTQFTTSDTQGHMIMTPTNVFVPVVAFLAMIVLGHWKLDGSDRDIRLVNYYIFERPVQPYSFL